MLALVAVLSVAKTQKIAVTVSGNALGMPRDVILKRLGKPSFKAGWPQPELIEYWAFADSHQRDLTFRFDHRGAAYQINGGVPQLDGVDVSSWSLDQIEKKLGTSDREGRLADKAPHLERHHRSETKYLAYPKHRLLVRQTPEHGIDFILFANPYWEPPTEPLNTPTP